MGLNANRHFNTGEKNGKKKFFFLKNLNLSPLNNEISQVQNHKKTNLLTVGLTNECFYR